MRNENNSWTTSRQSRGRQQHPRTECPRTPADHGSRAKASQECGTQHNWILNGVAPLGRPRFRAANPLPYRLSMSESSRARIRSAVLTWLEELAHRGGGYQIRGQLGWARPRDVATAIGRLAKEELVHLALSEKLDRVKVALSLADGPRSVAWVYRINAGGAAAAGIPAPPVLNPAPEGDQEDSRGIFTDAQWLGLEILRDAKSNGSLQRFASELGWMTAQEIRSVGLQKKDIVVQTEDVRVLAQAGLLERRRGNVVAGVRQKHFYRIGPRGETVSRLVWTKPRD
jgi:hypothetical protein